MRRFPAPVLPDVQGEVVLDGATSHHLLRVVGIAPGERVELYAPDGRVVAARLVQAEDGRAVLETDGAPARPDAGPDRWLLLAQLKGAAFDTALRMATELGATAILPVRADRSVAKGDKRDRWRRVVAAAVQQCGRAGGPEVHAPQSLAAALDALPDEVVVFWCDPVADAAADAVTGPAAVLIGPEGGWSEDEAAAARAAGARPLSLGRHVLRADTAVAAALARLG